MRKKFINQIEIKRYKCFDNLKVEDLKRVNLIAGKNNVAKKLKDDDISFINLSTNKKDEIVAITINSGMFASEMKQNHEVRGW